MKRVLSYCLGAVAFHSFQVGCAPIIWETEDHQRAEPGVPVQPAPLATSAAYRDTIGSLAYMEGLGPLRVRGYGLVVGLGRNGSRDCPKKVFDELVQSMYKQHRTVGHAVGVDEITPERLISAVDSAVVVIQGEIPPAARTGKSFDISVRSLPGTQTKSLRGGRLLPADLRVFRTSADGRSISGRALARAFGPIFLNPFVGAESATKSDPLRGSVLGGGIVTRERRIRLVLMEASHVRVRRIQDRINAQFPGSHRIADATSPSFVQLRLPREYIDDEAHFLELVRSLYLSRDSRFEGARASELAEELVRPHAPHARIALAFEGLGRLALPVLGDLYVSDKDFVSFHAGVAGLRLGDHIAADAVVLHAKNRASRYRFQAIRALAQAEKMGGAAVALRDLLQDEDPRVQIAAYESLIKRHDASIRSGNVGGDNFILDEVPMSTSSFVYAKRSASRRLAVFGSNLNCIPPLLYRAPDGAVTITASSEDDKLTILRVAVSTGTTSPPIPAPLALPALIRLLGGKADVDLRGRVTGLGLDYGAVVGAISSLSRDGSLSAKFILEQPNAAELFGPARPAGRPESEL